MIHDIRPPLRRHHTLTDLADTATVNSTNKAVNLTRKSPPLPHGPTALCTLCSMPDLPPSAQKQKTNRGFRLVRPADQRAILSRWKDLGGSESVSPHELEQLVGNEENRNVALRLAKKDAAVVINVIDKVLKRIEGPEETRLNALKMLRKLAGDTRQVPKSYLIGKQTRYTVKKQIIATGGFADVREGVLGNEVVAVRTLRTSMQTNVEGLHQAFCKESALWMNMSHPNILKLIAVDINPHTMRLSMISEMMANGHIMNYIKKNRANRLNLLKDVADGLQYLHGVGVIHGDLKGLNVLINNREPPQACIADFGFSTIAPWTSFNPTTVAGGGGTFSYMAPELYFTGIRSTQEADIYAFGMVVYEVVTGSLPFRQQRVVAIPMSAASGSRPQKPEDPVADGFGQGTWEFIESCWDTNPQQRPTAMEALAHFKSVAATSAVVDPGTFPLTQRMESGTSMGLSSSSRGFSQLFVQQSLNSSSRLQQAAFATHAFINPGEVRVPVAILPTIQDKSNILGRLRKKITTIRLLPSSLRGDA